MAQNVTLYNLLISCPGDIKDEVALMIAFEIYVKKIPNKKLYIYIFIIYISNVIPFPSFPSKTPLSPSFSPCSPTYSLLLLGPGIPLH